MAKPSILSIRFARSPDGAFTIEMDSPAGNCTSTLSLPWLLEPELSQMLHQLPGVIRGQRALGFSDPRKDHEETASVDAETIGEQLFDALFHSDSHALLENSLERVSDQESDLQIRLHFDPTDASVAALNRLPWELMKDRRLGEYLGLSSQTPIVRYLDVSRPHKTTKLRLPFRVLVVMSNPEGVAKLDLTKERKLIEQSWGKREDVQVDFLPRATMKELQQQLQGAKYHVLHFMGHGTVDNTSGVGKLVMENDDGSVDLVSGEMLGRILRDENLQLVFLNACQTAQTASSSEDSDPTDHAFSGVASSLVLAGVPAVLAMQFPISDEAAIAFSETFYRLLPLCRPVHDAVAEARKRVDQLQSKKDANEWATPVLFSRLDDGRVFHSPYRGKPLDGDQELLLSRLTERVRNFWIAGKLDQDIPIKPPIELTKELYPKALNRSIDELNEYGPDDEEILVPAGKTIALLFDENDRKLLILGEPGFGKSITLLALAQHLIKRHDADRLEPVPVVLMLSSWSGSKLTIGDWIVHEIANKYKVPSRDAAEWLRDDHIVLMLDGLDEVAPEKREECVVAINRFVAEETELDGRCYLAVCCRFDDYKQLKNRIDFNGAIKLQPLSEEQIRDFLAKCGTEFTGLQEFLESDPKLLSDAQSPLVLGMMSLAYSMNPDEFAELSQKSATCSDSKQTQRRLLVETYIDRVFAKRRRAEHQYDREEILSGLSWLARKMREQHQSVFLIENLQPSWLKNRLQGFFYFVTFSVVLGLLLGGILTGIWHHSDLVDPSEPPAQETQGYWFYVTPLWVLLVAVWDWWWTVHDRDDADRNPISTKFGARALHMTARIVTFYAVWALLWMILSWFVGTRDDKGSLLLWLSHPLGCGVTIAPLYALAVGGRSTMQYIGTTEQLRWSTKWAWIGSGIGLSVGFIAWIVYLIVAGIPWGQMTDNFWFYLPLGLVYGFLFGGLRMRSSDIKTRPNEGIMLSVNNCLYGGSVVGAVSVVTLMVVLSFAFRDVAWSTIWPASIWQGIFVGVIAMAWFGLIDIIRHYSLRGILFLTKTTPWHLPRFCDQASDLILLQKIGGGYIFRNHLLFDYFLNESRSSDEHSDG